jgi:hypothetical protein
MDLEKEFFAEGTPPLAVENFHGMWCVKDTSRDEWVNDHAWFTREEAEDELARMLARHA